MGRKKILLKKFKLTITKEQLRVKPRLGVQQTKVIKDKTKYTRKKKHK
jgi:hypothetical protein